MSDSPTRGSWYLRLADRVKEFAKLRVLGPYLGRAASPRPVHVDGEKQLRDRRDAVLRYALATQTCVDADSAPGLKPRSPALRESSWESRPQTADW